MNRKYLGMSLVCARAFFVLSCGTGQQLDSIQVAPTAVVFGGVCPAGVTGCPTVQLTATGIYSHPPATKDITAQVTWKSDVPDVAVVNSSGLVTAGPGCGVANITASTTAKATHDSLITSGPSNVTVDGPSTSNCPTTPP